MTYYFTCIVGAAVCHSWWGGGRCILRALPDLGASGGIFGLLLAYGMLFLNQRVMLLFLLLSR